MVIGGEIMATTNQSMHANILLTTLTFAFWFPKGKSYFNNLRSSFSKVEEINIGGICIYRNGGV